MNDIGHQVDITSPEQIEKMYKDIDCKDETKNFDEAKYGDLAFWATKGKWRMPSKADWNFLKDEIGRAHV